MGATAFSYYVSGVQAKGTTGTLNGLTVYPFSDVSVFSTDGVPVKTVAANDKIGILNDASYTLVKNCTLPAGTLLAGTVLRGANSATGLADDTRALRVSISGNSNYKILASNSLNVYADLSLTAAKSSDSLLHINNSAITAYNIHVSPGTSSAASYGINVSVADQNAVVACYVSGGPTSGTYYPFTVSGTGIGTRLLWCRALGYASASFDCGGSTMTVAYCVAQGGAYGFNCNRQDHVYFHNVADNCTSGDGFYTGGSTSYNRGLFIGNYATHCGGYGYNGGSRDRHSVFINNAYHACTSGAENAITAPVYKAAVDYDPGWAAGATDITPTNTASIPTLGELISGITAGRNLAGALTLAGSATGVVGPWGTVR